MRRKSSSKGLWLGNHSVLLQWFRKVAQCIQELTAAQTRSVVNNSTMEYIGVLLTCHRLEEILHQKRIAIEPIPSASFIRINTTTAKWDPDEAKHQATFGVQLRHPSTFHSALYQICNLKAQRRSRGAGIDSQMLRGYRIIHQPVRYPIISAQMSYNTFRNEYGADCARDFEGTLERLQLQGYYEGI